MNGTTNNNPKKKKGCLLYIVIAFVVIVVIGIIGGAGTDTPEGENINSDIDLETTGDKTTQATKYTAGHYKVGEDIPAGEYYLIGDGVMPYFNVTTDANGEDILIYSVFSGNSIVEVCEGEYFQLTSCYAIPYTEAPVAKSDNGYLGDGFYQIGRDIPAGEYKLEEADDAVLPSFSVYNDLRHDINSFGVLENSRYVELKEGQYLHLTDCKIYIGE